MSTRIQVVSPQLQVPAIEAPRLARMDVSSGLRSVAHGFDEVAKAQRLTRVTQAQIGFADAFRELDDGVRRAPWNEKQALFDKGASDIRARWLDGVDDPKVRQALAPDFARTYGTYLAHTREDAFKGEAASNIASTQDAMSRFAEQAAHARSRQERDMIVGNGAALADHLVIGGYLDDLQRRKLLGHFLNEVDSAAVRAAIDDAARPPAVVIKALREGDYSNLTRDQVRTFIHRAEAEDVRRRTASDANRRMEHAAAMQAAPEAISDDLTSRLTSGKPLGATGALVGRLPPQAQADYKALASGADTIFRECGDLRTRTPQEIASAVDRLRPHGAPVVAQARAYAETIAAHRAQDPGAAVREAMPNVATAWRAYEEGPSAPSLQAALRASRAAQTAVGIPAEQQGVAPLAIAEHEARTILNAKPEDQLTALRELKARCGSFAPLLLHQIERFLPPQLREADAQASPLAGEIMWRHAIERRAKPSTHSGGE